jgi:hypothetical protein
LRFKFHRYPVKGILLLQASKWHRVLIRSAAVQSASVPFGNSGAFLRRIFEKSKTACVPEFHRHLRICSFPDAPILSDSSRSEEVHRFELNPPSTTRNPRLKEGGHLAR